MIETVLDKELCEHPGYDRHAPEGRGSGNSRNGVRSKTVLTDARVVPSRLTYRAIVSAALSPRSSRSANAA
ncbi:hypothetical protein MOTT12_02136 [Mycobacterium intracellulare subsp. yongonense]|nr:hypothetical protein MOTT12_02136 [Mycobacterium intracellulare subsp. yongonense]ARR82907.1 hypothetical protein MOTT27_02086 [Mycobacterium intracellulare subsp. yongonense]SKV65127.1 transposase, Mutator family protein [Mycobacteroides abscessus subsp. abscessus]